MEPQLIRFPAWDEVVGPLYLKTDHDSLGYAADLETHLIPLIAERLCRRQLTVAGCALQLFDVLDEIDRSHSTDLVYACWYWLLEQGIAALIPNQELAEAVKAIFAVQTRETIDVSTAR